MANPVLQRLVDERTQANEAIDRILDTANESERDPSDSERELIGRYRTRLTELEPQIGELLDLEETREKARDARDALSRGGNNRPQPDEQPTYERRPDPAAGEYQSFAQYARDQLLVKFPYIGASVEPEVRQRAGHRLQRAVETVLTSDVPGLLRPLHVNEIVGVIDANRPIVSSARMLGLNAGSIQYPKITARPTVAEQVTQKTEVGVGTMTVTMQTKVAKTYLSAANFSWQTVNWSSPDALALWFTLAAEDFAKKTELEAATALAAADATPTVAAGHTIEAWTGAIAAAAGAIYSATGRRADTVYAGITAGYEIIGLASAVSPVFLATGSANLASGQYGSIGGLPLVISPQMPATTVVVGDSSALLAAETPGAPVELRAVEPSIGGLEVGIIGAFLFEIVDASAFSELTVAA